MSTRSGREGSAAAPDSIRAFFGLILPDPILEPVVRWQRDALTGEGLRPIPRSSMHLTLVFLGQRGPSEIERARAALGKLEPRPVAVRLEPHPVLVPPRRTRVVAFSVDGPDVVELQLDLAARLVGGGLIEPPDRPFWPHLSVARVRDSSGPRRKALEALPALPEEALKTGNAVRLALYRSELRTQGARYETLADIDLSPDGDG